MAGVSPFSFLCWWPRENISFLFNDAMSLKMILIIWFRPSVVGGIRLLSLSEFLQMER